LGVHKFTGHRLQVNTPFTRHFEWIMGVYNQTKEAGVCVCCGFLVVFLAFDSGLPLWSFLPFLAIYCPDCDLSSDSNISLMVAYRCHRDFCGAKVDLIWPGLGKGESTEFLLLLLLLRLRGRRRRRRRRPGTTRNRRREPRRRKKR